MPTITGGSSFKTAGSRPKVSSKFSATTDPSLLELDGVSNTRTSLVDMMATVSVYRLVVKRG